MKLLTINHLSIFLTSSLMLAVSACGGSTDLLNNDKNDLIDNQTPLENETDLDTDIITSPIDNNIDESEVTEEEIIMPGEPEFVFDSSNTPPTVTNTQNVLILDKDINPAAVLFNVNVTDNEYDDIQYTIENNQDFKIDAAGQVYLNKSIDLNSTNYSALQISITDYNSVISYSIKVQINIEDSEEDQNIVVETPTDTPDFIQQLDLSNQNDHIQLSWSSNLNTESYIVYRNGFLIAIVNEPFYEDYSASNNQFYTYSISVIDDSMTEFKGVISSDIISLNQFSLDFLTTDHINISITDDNNAGNAVIDLSQFYSNNVDPDLISVNVDTDWISFNASTHELSFMQNGTALTQNRLIELSVNYQQESKVLDLMLVKIDSAITNSTGVDLEYFTGLAPDALVTAINSQQPNSITVIDQLSTEVNKGSNYGQRLTGYYQAPISGTYQFYTASDDHSQFWISSDLSSKNLTLAAQIIGYTSVMNFIGHVQAVDLIAGQYYYFKTLHTEGGGGDHLAIGVKLPNSEEIVLMESDLTPRSQVESFIPNIALLDNATVKISNLDTQLKEGESLALVYGLIDGQDNIDFWDHSLEITTQINSNVTEFTLTGLQSGLNYYVAIQKTSHYKVEMSNVITLSAP